MRQVLRIANVLFTLILVAGCNRSPSAAAYVPRADQARECLTRALTEWNNGQPTDSFSGTPVVQFADGRSKSGRKLVEFAVLGELPVDSGRRFQVRLRFDQPAETVKSQYVVFGIDPIWVVLQEEFDMLTHWDHSMPDPGEGAPAAIPK